MSTPARFVPEWRRRLRNNPTLTICPLVFSLTCSRAVDSLQGKTRVMELMTHADPDVRFQALLTVQRLVSHAWAP